MNFSPDFSRKLAEKAAECGVPITAEQADRLSRYFDMLVEKNKVMNLTAVTDEEGVLTRHFADSLAGAVQSAAGKDLLSGIKLSAIDVGTGAGLPGMVLKIVFPELELKLFDSLNKRLIFLNEVIEALELKGVSTLHGRAEDAAHDKKYREKYDLVFARAVADLSVLSEYCLPFAKEGGRFVSYKTKDSAEEVKNAGKAITLLGGRIESEAPYHSDPETERLVITIQKERPTPARFPRKAGTPAKEPIR